MFCHISRIHVKGSDYISNNKPLLQLDQAYMLYFAILRSVKNLIQLDWTSCADTQEINLPRDREGYDGFLYTDEKLSTRRIQWCGLKYYIFFVGELFLKNG